MSYNKISEISDNLKYDLIHNNEKIKEIFENDKIVEFYLFIRKYYRFLLENEYGTSKEEKKHISKAISGNLLAKMISKINDTGADIFFTKESRMYTLFNLLKNLDSKKDISKEFNYASYIGFNVYESNNEMRVSIVFSRGFNCRDIIEGCLDSRHRAPLKDEELLCDLSLQCFVDHCEAVLNKK
ncbi:inositol hexakisphosphate and diphosphoinositol-pentakisphosphate kinase [Binucleata daphniae]